MSKTYQTAAIATKIAARLTKSKGAEHIAIEQAPGKWVVMTKEAVDDLVNEVGQEMQEHKEPEVQQPETSTKALTLLEAMVQEHMLENPGAPIDEVEYEFLKILKEEGKDPNQPAEGYDAQPESKPEPVKVEVAGNITVTLPAGSYEKGGYVYTPAIDGKARWFKTDKLLGMALEDGRVKITVTQKVLKSRGLTPEMLETQAA